MTEVRKEIDKSNPDKATIERKLETAIDAKLLDVGDKELAVVLTRTLTSRPGPRTRHSRQGLKAQGQDQGVGLPVCP